MSPFVYAMPVAGRWLIHAPLHGVSALVNSRAVEELASGGGAPAHGNLAELSRALAAEPSPPGPREGALAPGFVGLIPTRACNLACVYCGFGADRDAGEGMDASLAVAAVDWMAETSRNLGRDAFEVHFFGGEPFCAAGVVDVAVHRARKIGADGGPTPRFEVATNGCFDEDRARFVGDYFGSVVLSFDGPEEAHDRHRPARGGRGSFPTVARTASLLSASPAELCFRTCVTDRTVESLPEIAAWFCDTFQPAVINFETLQPTAQSAEAGLRPPDPLRFAVQCVRASRTLRQMGVQPVYAAATAPQPRVTFCPVGNDTLIVSPDGRVSACYLRQAEWQARGLDLDLGHLDGSGALRLDGEAVERARRLVAAKPRCERCFCRWSCAGGCHVNHTYPGCPDADDDFCVQTRLITACTLLEEMGHEALADSLLDDPAGMESLARRRSDRLPDWGEDDA